MTGRVSRLVPILVMALAVTACSSGGPRTAATQTPTRSVPPAASTSSTAMPTVPTAPAPVRASAPPTIASASPSLPTPGPAEPTPIVEQGAPAPPLRDLVSPEGAFDLADLAGHPVLLFFGYTHCPDVCPMTVGELVLALHHRPDTRVVYVTVDPERDTIESLTGWTRYLPDGFVALTGSPSAIRAVADAYGVRYARVDSASAAGYSVSHTAFVHLIDADGRMRVTFPFGTGWATMVRSLDALTTPVQEDGT